jgi:hypothetical protein
MLIADVDIKNITSIAATRPVHFIFVVKVKQFVFIMLLLLVRRSLLLLINFYAKKAISTVYKYII